MPSERWQSCKEIFNLAVERPPDERATFIEGSCDGDEFLRREVERLLKYHETSGDFIKSPAFAVAPELLVADPEVLVGQHLGCYRVDAIAGSGGMGVVYLAYDERLERQVALKLLPPSMVPNEAELERLKREARTASALNHPNIVTIHEIGQVEFTHYVATEFIEGTTLRERMTKGSTPPNEALDIAMQVASALSVAHRAGIVHRDIKPENIMLRPDGYVKVLDFGIAKITQPAPPGARTSTALQSATQQGAILGTTRYMSPEQARGQTVDARSDLWSLGVVLYEMLAGRPPFEGESPTDVIAAILLRDPQQLERRAPIVPPALQRVVERCLRKDPAERYQMADEMLSELRAVKESAAAGVSAPRYSGARWIGGAVVAALLVSLGVFYRWREIPPRNSPPAVIEKSIAVLPFENLSKDEENAFFAGGVQDEILSNLAKIADLKVISRTSVMQYQNTATRNLREIAQQLGVAHVLEGSVQRAANRVRVNAQLIDARTDAHIWAEHYDRDLADVFAIQSEIAATIAEQLQAKLSPNEKAAIARPPTTDVAAFDLYIRAQKLADTSVLSAPTRKKLLHEASDLLNEAVARDPSFFQAYCLLARVHDYGYFQGIDRTAATLAAAQAALDAAFRLQPDSGKAHLARAWHLYYGYFDCESALIDLEIAGRKLPNDPRIFELTGYIRARQGYREEGLRNLEQAVELDPRNPNTLAQISITYLILRRYPEAAAMLDRALAILPDNATRVARANVEFAWKADTRPMHKAIDSIRSENPAALAQVASYWLVCALAERDPIAVTAALAALGKADVNFRPNFWEGCLARMSNDKTKAEAAFTAARKEQVKLVQAQPEDGQETSQSYFGKNALSGLGMIDAGLGRKEEALREGRRALELSPVAKNLFEGASNIENLAIIAAWVGEKELACEQLEIAIRLKASDTIDYGHLKLSPWWDPLRGDPRFEKIVASLAPKSAR